MQLHVEEMTPEEAALFRERAILRTQLRKESREANEGVVRCTYCRKPLTKAKTHFSRIIPTMLGGETDEKNAVLSCSVCCNSKGSRTLDEWCSHLMVMQGEIMKLMATRPYKAEKPAA